MKRKEPPTDDDKVDHASAAAADYPLPFRIEYIRSEHGHASPSLQLNFKVRQTMDRRYAYLTHESGEDTTIQCMDLASMKLCWPPVAYRSVFHTVTCQVKGNSHFLFFTTRDKQQRRHIRRLSPNRSEWRSALMDSRFPDARLGVAWNQLAINTRGLEPHSPRTWFIVDVHTLCVANHDPFTLMSEHPNRSLHGNYYPVYFADKFVFVKSRDRSWIALRTDDPVHCMSTVVQTKRFLLTSAVPDGVHLMDLHDTKGMFTSIDTPCDKSILFEAGPDVSDIILLVEHDRVLSLFKMDHDPIRSILQTCVGVNDMVTLIDSYMTHWIPYAVFPLSLNTEWEMNGSYLHTTEPVVLTLHASGQTWNHVMERSQLRLLDTLHTHACVKVVGYYSVPILMQVPCTDDVV